MSDLTLTLSPELRARLAALEGLISPEVGMALASLAARVPAGLPIVELGSYRGKSTAYLAAGSFAVSDAPVFAVDPWDTPGNITGRFGFADPATLLAFHAQLASVDLLRFVTPLRGFSTDVAKHWLRPIGLLYIDGSHTLADVLADVKAWGKFIPAGGVIAFDDYRTDRNPGVATVVDALRAGKEFRDWVEGPAPLVYGVKA